MKMDIGVRISGPLFKNATGALNQAVGDSVQMLMEKGEQRLDAMLRQRPAGVFLSAAEARPGKASTGHYRRNLHGTRNGLQATIDDNRVVYGPWLEGISSRNQRSRFKGYASFRRTADWLNKMAKDIFIKAILKVLR